MKIYLIAFAFLLTLTGCFTPPSRLVYSNGFSFSNYDYLVVAKSEGRDTSTALYGMDIEFANLMSRYNMKIIGDKEYEKLPPETQKRALDARMSVTASNGQILFSVSFDDAVTGRTVSSITTQAHGNIFDVYDRTKAFEAVSDTIIKALKQDKGLKITDQ
ncbi:MAG: hypothetical protein WCK57_10860 [Verrucomicrobiae bacterium]